MSDALPGAGAMSGRDHGGVHSQAAGAATDKDLQRLLQSRLGGGGLGGLQRSGSAPPYVDDLDDLASLCSNTWNQQSGGWPDGLGSQALEDAASASRDLDALADPAYAEYYYQHRNINPRLPPPQSSSSSWQRSTSSNYDNTGLGGVAADQGAVGSSLFSHVDGMYQNGLDSRQQPLNAHHQEQTSGAASWGHDAGKGLMGLSALATKQNGGMSAPGNTWDGQEAGGMGVSSPVFGHPSSPFAPRPVGAPVADNVALTHGNLAIKAARGSGGLGFGSAPGTPTKRTAEGLDSRLSHDDSVTRFSRQATISSQNGMYRSGTSSKLGWNPPQPDLGSDGYSPSSPPVTPTMGNVRNGSPLRSAQDHMVSQVAEQLAGQHLDAAGRIRAQGHPSSPRNASPLTLSPRSINPSSPAGSYFQPKMDPGIAPPPDMMHDSIYSHLGPSFSQPMQNLEACAGLDPALAAAFLQQQPPQQMQGDQAAMQAQQLQAQAAAAMYMMNPMMYAQPNIQAAAMAQAAAMGMYPGMGMGLPPALNPAMLMHMYNQQSQVGPANGQAANSGGAGMSGLPPELAAYQQRMMEMYAATAAAAAGGPNAISQQAAALAAAAAASSGPNDPMASRMAAMLGAMQGSNPNSGKASPEPELPNDLNTYADERPRSGRGRDRRDGGRGRRGDNRDSDHDHACPLLEQLKGNKAKKIELQDVVGNVMEFCTDQHGSRFIQLKLESSSPSETAAIFEEIMPTVISLMTDVFGNYVVQKFFEHGSEEQRMRLSESLDDNVLSLSLQMYGCRVVQKALEILPLSHQQKIVAELSGHVMRCVRDQNGNHVIQKCIECVPTSEVAFMLDSFIGHVASLSAHPYGCRVIQRVLEHCTDEIRVRGVMTEVLAATCELVQDQYGNYVVQHVLERGVPVDRTTIVKQLAGRIVEMSQHKFASNVVEKCLQHGSYADRQILIGEIIGNSEENDPLQSMMKDQFGNYVVQKLLEVCDDGQREQLLTRIKQHLHNLKKYTYGKHIVARVEKLITNTQKLIRGASSASAQLLPGPEIGSPMNSPRKRMT